MYSVWENPQRGQFEVFLHTSHPFYPIPPSLPASHVNLNVCEHLRMLPCLLKKTFISTVSVVFLLNLLRHRTLKQIFSGFKLQCIFLLTQLCSFQLLEHQIQFIHSLASFVLLMFYFCGFHNF